MKQKKYKKRKPLGKGHAPFTFDEKALEQIGFAAGGFQLFLETTPCAQGEDAREYLLHRFVLACAMWCGSKNSARDNARNGHGYLTGALHFCCGKQEEKIKKPGDGI